MTQRIVINACFGGFSLSPQGVEAFAKRKGIDKLYWFVNARKADGGIDFDRYESTDDPGSEFISYPFTTPDPPKKGDDKAWEATYFGNRDIERDDPDLVAVVEELEADANGRHASLVIVEIPDGVPWEISEYDGSEHVAEQHRTWHGEGS